MRSITDIFIKHPVLAIVVNVVLVLVGWRAISRAAGAAVPADRELLGRHHHGVLRRERGDRSRLPDHADRARGLGHRRRRLHRIHAAAPGSARSTVRLKLNHNSTAALAEVTARLQQVRSELPQEAEAPVVEVQRADRPYATFYLSFSSNERSVPAITDWLVRTLQPQLATLEGVQRVDDRRRPAARHARVDRSRSPRRAQPRAGRRARRARSATTISPRSARPRATSCR